MATYYTLTESGLRYADYGYTLWNTNVNNYNLTLLNNTLLKLRNLLDVDDSGLTTGDALTYVASSQKWERRPLPTGWHLITSTTTTTTTTSSTSTTS
jgi:hypothetical protein